MGKRFVAGVKHGRGSAESRPFRLASAPGVLAAIHARHDLDVVPHIRDERQKQICGLLQKSPRQQP